jgi:hypothetical protein
MKENLSIEEYTKFISHFHNALRKDMELPNKVFTFQYTKDYKIVKMVFFDLEPVGKSYTPCRDEDGVPYILVED